MVKRIVILIWMLLVMFQGTQTPAAYAQSDQPTALVLTASGPLTPAMGEYLRRGILIAEQRKAEVLIFQLNTPGGSLDLMNQMEQDIRASSVPIIVYVSPNGAMAGSAGTIITLAGHAAAMAPETAIGAASPVGDQGQDLPQTEQAKVTNIMKATVRSLAERRGAQAINLAEETIASAKAASASEALQVGLVDFIANDVDELLHKLDGFTVIVNGSQRTLHTANAAVQSVPPTLIEQILQALTNPNIVFLLLTIGVQAVLIELSSPGGWVAGFFGAVCLALAGYGLGILPVNWFGLIFLGLAFVLFILDIKAPTHGALTTAGAASLIMGALVLFNSPTTPVEFRVSPLLVVGTSILTALSFGVMVSFAIRAQKIPIRTGRESIVGRVGTVRRDLAPRGTVQVGGELWSADLIAGEEPLPKGTRVEVIDVDGIKLHVRKTQ